jgi:prephenate dehydrogenase
MKIDTLTIIGVGLIGGSIGLAARRRGLATHVIGAGRQQASLDRARSIGAIDESTLNLASAVERAEFAVFCTPVDKIVEQVVQYAAGCRPGTLLCDAGSTKVAIVEGIEGKLPAGVYFVGSHPLAGSEKHGPEFADAELFQGRVTVLTPTPKTEPAAVERVSEFWQALGARVRLMSPEEHDRGLALTSHLPHLVASALAGVLPDGLHELTATGFRDATRIAAGAPSLWTAILTHNRLAVLDALARLTERLGRFRTALEANDSVAVDDLLAQAKKVRDALGS